MISPSEGTSVINTGREHLAIQHTRLLDIEEGRDVSRLEFYPIETVVSVDKADVVEEIDSAPLLETEVTTSTPSIKMEDVLVQVEAARMEARTDARREWEEELNERIERQRIAIKHSCEQFLRERARYFAEVEAEVVKLSLAVAARVLNRESKLDPLLLAGAVRVALEKVADDSETVLRVPTEDCEMWRTVFADKRYSPKVVGDERLDADDCVLETSVGKVQLGVRAQLEEIERGFFDLMQLRPA
jgi:flagellar assembly protein FliH